MNNENNEMNNSDPEFDLFAKDVDDNLQEQLAKGSYKWTNKYTAVLGVLVIITGSVSGGIWYGSKHSAAATTNALAGFASRIRGASGAGGFGAATGAASGAGAAGAGAAGGFAGAAGGFGGGSRITGTVTKVNGTTVTITLDAAPTTPIAAGDSVSVRATSGGANGTAAGGAPAGAPSTGGTRGTGTTSATKPSTTGTTTGAAGAPTGAGPAGAPGAGGGGGGRFNNPAFTDCLAKNGVTLAAGARPDRTDPKVAAAMQACFSTLGAGAPGAPGAGGAPAGGGTGAGRSGRGTATAPTPTPSSSH